MQSYLVTKQMVCVCVCVCVCMYIYTVEAAYYDHSGTRAF
jgi:hypothetical protein